MVSSKKVEKASSSKKATTDSAADIDGIFSAAPKKDQKKVEQKEKVKRAESEDEGESKTRYTEDGLPIFKWEELVSKSAGDTALCPFDCECCF